MMLLEITHRMDAIKQAIVDLEAEELAKSAELGRKLVGIVPEGSEFTSLAVQIKDVSEKLTALRDELHTLGGEYKQRIFELTCFTCATVNSDGSRFCEECGAKLGEPPREYCMQCHTMNGQNMKFCGECGAKLTEIA